MRPEQEPEAEDGAQSSFHLEISLAVGYTRRRARLAGRWEASITSVGLLLGGTALVLLFVFWLLRNLSLV
jgi:hypothetical protein